MSGLAAKRGVLLLSSVAASLVLAEAGLRVFYPTRNTLCQLDERVLFRLVPGARKLFVHHPMNGGGRIWVHVNSQGFRGHELRQYGSSMRVVVYGDSFIMGEFSDLPDTFAQQLEGALTQRARRPIEVVNAGVVAYGPDQSVLRMEHELSQLNPQLVILALFADNDLGDLLRNKLFRVGPNGGLEPNAFILSDEVRAEFQQAKRPLLVKMIARQLERLRRSKRPPGTEQTPEAYRLQCEQEYSEYVEEGDNRVRNLLGDVYDADVALDPDSPSAKYKTRLLAALLKRAGATARHAGVPLVILVIPSPIDVCEHFAIRVDAARYPAYSRDTLTRVAAEAAQQAGLPCLNLFEVFRANGPDALYFPYGDDHWNAAGQSLAAREMADFLCALGLAGEAASP